MTKPNVMNPTIIVTKDMHGKVYYQIQYYDVDDRTWHIGYGSYYLDNVQEWFNTELNIVDTDVDVQPVNWISVKDRMPETNAIGIAHILAYDRYEGVVKADFLDESANYVNGSHIFVISNTSAQLYKVTHWKPLPEPPKDCDTDG